MSHHHEHTHDSHEHNHGVLPVVLFLVGLLLYITAFFVTIKIIQNFMWVTSLLLAGHHIIVEGFIDTIRETLIEKRFKPNIHLLMSLGAFGAILIQEFSEAALLILIFAGAHFLEEFAENKSKKEITSLLKMTPSFGRKVNSDGSIEVIDVIDLKIGDTLSVLHGDQVPTDGVIISGYPSIDEQAITGESMPKDKGVGDFVYGSTINGQTSFMMTVTKKNEDSVFSRIKKLVLEAQTNISKTAVLIKRIEPIYVTIVLLLAPFFFLLWFYVFKDPFPLSFYKTMVFLIGASPCALAATDIPATLSALSSLAKRGVLFKGGSYLSNLTDIKVIAFDKTGTITIGKPVVTDEIWIKDDFTKPILVSMEQQSNHPLADAILKHYDDVLGIDLEVNNHIGLGIESYYQEKTYFVGKLEYFLDPHVLTVLEQNNLKDSGKTIICFGLKEEVYLILGIQDTPKTNASQVIGYFNQQKVDTVMISGDSVDVANNIAKPLGIETVYGDVLPEEKSAMIDTLKRKGLTCMVGDGINDAVALVKADIGIAMKNGTDIAIEVADGVLMDNDLMKLKLAHQVSKRLKKIVIQNMVFALLVVLFLVISNVFLDLNLGVAVSIHEGSTLVVILNGLRLLKIKS